MDRDGNGLQRLYALFSPMSMSCGVTPYLVAQRCPYTLVRPAGVGTFNGRNGAITERNFSQAAVSRSGSGQDIWGAVTAQPSSTRYCHMTL